MEKIKPGIISSGVPSLDDVIQGFRLGDNVVWQVDDIVENNRRELRQPGGYGIYSICGFR